MSTAGILRPDEVVFYHPLDNFTEHTQSQAWSGSAGFTAGKVGTSVSAVAGDSFTAGAVNNRGGSDDYELAALSSSSVLVSYHSGGIYRLRVGTVSGTDITMGPETSYQNVPGNTGHAGLVALDSTTALMSYRGYSPDEGHLHVLTVSGTDVTAGPVTYFSSIPRGTRMAKLDSTHVALIYSRYNSGTENGEARIITVSGNTTTVGAAHEFDTGLDYKGNAVVALDSTRFLLCWVLTTGDIEGKVAVATVSGTDITFGTAKDISTLNPGPKMTGGERIDAILLDSSTVYIAYNRNSYNLMGRVATVSGADITLGAETTLAASAVGGACGLSSTEVAYGWRSGLVLGNQALMTKATVSGTDITFGANTVYHTTINGYPYALAKMSAGSIVSSHIISGTGYLAVGELSLASTVTASTPGAYPAAAGDDRVVVAMWANKLGDGSSVITVQRDYTVEFTSTTISLGPATATWSDAAIGTLMGTMAGGEHLLVADFEHTGSGNWNLRTSLDGAAFVDQGAQDSGTRSTAPASADPELDIASGTAGQWIDELVMWSGDKAAFDMFTSEELANLNDLADTFGETMDKYEENYGAPICWQATAVLPDGTVWRDSGSGPCPAVIRVPRGAADIVVTDEGKVVSPRIQEG